MDLWVCFGTLASFSIAMLSELISSSNADGYPQCSDSSFNQSHIICVSHQSA